ncbi:MAG: hypothetical protein MJA31_09350 [Clostridia bacterium]|nr:hypothetical protein [Clostridia bacterium]
MFFKKKEGSTGAVEYSSEEVQNLLKEFSKLLYDVSQYYEEQIAKYESIIESLKKNG